MSHIGDPLISDLVKQVDPASVGVEPSIMLTAGADTVPENIATSATISIGGSVSGYINSSTDEDWFEVQLVAGQSYEITLNGSGVSALSDPLVRLYNSAGVQISSNDDGGPGLNSLLSYTPSTSGTYFIAADAYSTRTGGYTLSINTVAPPSILDSIDWGTVASPTNGVINVYFAGSGETFDGVTSQGWSSYEAQRAMAAFDTIEDYIPVTFNQVASSANAHFKLVTTTGVNYLGYFNPPGTNNAGVGVFATDGTGWNTVGGLEQGSYGFVTLIHEYGHGLGLAHPHDNGGTSTVMAGVGSSTGDYGDQSLNQGVFTTMSYNDGWRTAPHGTPTQGSTYGWQGTMMALDVAALQSDYGANNSFNAGNDTYVLPTSNVTGTFYASIWDAGGATDTIQHSGSAGAVIDLRAASATQVPGGGGHVSYVTGVHGGFTIAKGVTIERALGGSGDDTITGNDTNNGLYGNGGTDALFGMGGDDWMEGGAGTDSLRGGDDNDIVFGGEGNDSLFGDAGNDQLFGQGGADWMEGGAGTDILRGWNGNDFLFGGDDNDSMYGDAGDDQLFGQNGNDWMEGDLGADILRGWNGNDFLFGGDGSDRLFGDAGNDGLYGQNGNDWMEGGLGSDTLRGWNGNDTLFGGDDADFLYGDANDDGLYGQGGNDWLEGGLGNDTLRGWNGDDTLLGGNGDDFLFGDAGNDILIGNEGRDQLTGGLGSDVFRFSAIVESASGFGDTIADFDANDASEDIVLLGLLNGSFNFLGASSNNFTATANTEAHFNEATGLLTIDVSGNGVGDMEIILSGVSLVNLDATDFSFA